MTYRSAHVPLQKSKKGAKVEFQRGETVAKRDRVLVLCRPLKTADLMLIWECKHESVGS